LTRTCHLLSAAFALTASTANAALESRLNGSAVYDTQTNLTWLANANLLGAGSWGVTNSLVDQLNAGAHLGFGDWRLPSTFTPDATCSSPDGTNGFGCTRSEMGHLFYISLGGTAGTSILSSNNGAISLFQSVQPAYYWSSTISPIYPGPFTFVFGSGMQDASNNYGSSYFAWLVRTGDVTPIPEPSGLALLLLGIPLVLGAKKHFSRQ